MGMPDRNQRAFSANQTAYMEAYRQVSDRFALRARQRDQLDQSNLYIAIMEAGKLAAWDLVRELLIQAQILTGDHG